LICQPWVDFINILWVAFTCADSKSLKNTVKASVFFALLGSVCLKAASKMLMKSTPCYVGRLVYRFAMSWFLNAALTDWNDCQTENRNSNIYYNGIIIIMLLTNCNKYYVLCILYPSFAGLAKITSLNSQITTLLRYQSHHF